jgi:hypothetical protein
MPSAHGNAVPAYAEARDSTPRRNRSFDDKYFDVFYGTAPTVILDAPGGGTRPFRIDFTHAGITHDVARRNDFELGAQTWPRGYIPRAG